MRKDVEGWYRKVRQEKIPGALPRHAAAIAGKSTPMERVAVNIAGRLPLSAQRNRYIYMAMDYITMWPEASVILDQETTMIARY